MCVCVWNTNELSVCLATDYIFVYVCVCIICLKWFQKNVDRQKDSRIYFRNIYEYIFACLKS